MQNLETDARMLEPLNPFTGEVIRETPANGQEFLGLDPETVAPQTRVLPVTYNSGPMTGIYKKARDLGGKACLAGCFIFSACGCGPVTEIPQGHIGLLTRFGVYEAKLGAGLYTWNPVTESIQIVDVR
jgi:hypothetical protein